MFPDPARLGVIQIIVSVLSVVGATLVSALMVRRRGVSPRTGARLLGVCAALAVASWVRFGQLHVLAIRPDGAGPDAARVEQHRPLQFHEFFHYYVGPKYFAELGYLGLYDCTALADAENRDRGRRQAPNRRLRPLPGRRARGQAGVDGARRLPRGGEARFSRAGGGRSSKTCARCSTWCPTTSGTTSSTTRA